MRRFKFIILAGLFFVSTMSAFSAGKEIYPAPASAQADLQVALQQAAASHKNILLDFGGNWCPDCQILDLYFHDAQNLPLLTANFVLVHINIGRIDANLDLAQRYGIPLNKGVPAVAVLDPAGKLLYSQQNGEFESMRRMESASVTGFLKRWSPKQ